MVDVSTGVLDVGFSSPVGPGLPVEVVDYRELLERMGSEHLASAQRPSFGILMVIADGSGTHTLDFELIKLARGRMMFIRPGQVHQWHASDSLHAKIVIARAELCRVSDWFSGDSAFVDLDGASADTAVDLLSVLIREQDRFRPDPSSVGLVGHVFAGLGELFEMGTPAARSADLPDAYVAYRRAIESGLGKSRDARWFIRDLGYSERTVTRACQEVAGLTAKGVLDQRIMLEAKRLLAHTDDPVGSIGRRLGFAEASNFNKFFARHGSVLPSQFRNGLRATGWSAEPRS